MGGCGELFNSSRGQGSVPPPYGSERGACDNLLSSSRGQRGPRPEWDLEMREGLTARE